MLAFYLCTTIMPFLLPESLLNRLVLAIKDLKKLARQGKIAKGRSLSLKLTTAHRAIFDEDKREDWPSYKFYTDLALDLRRLSRTYGSPLSEAWSQIKLGLSKDIVLERDIIKEKSGSYFQFLLLTVITWSFIAVSSEVMEKAVSYEIIFIIALAQILGAIVFKLGTYLFNRYFLEGIGQYFAMIYRLEALTEAGPSITECLKLSGYTSIKHKIGPRSLDFTLENWRKTGESPLEELKLYELELWESYERLLKKFKTFILALRFSILALFYLSSYFVFILSLVASGLNL